ncbi:hypothetical protein BV898_13291 [Hypsibius exemplaris]|uniref:G-protein coupled receptors family 1 profile domain-containing protein n=1 Tax=Hypsibius exemplaris TaxID=2072580 RepID=A0A1W0WB19_HYPEX|nr:hypothetical protein BV898_13291 [Hypsibius exemplaris]
MKALVTTVTVHLTLTVLAYISLVVQVAAFLINASIILVYIRRPGLLKPFNVHFFILLIEDVFCGILLGSLQLQKHLLPGAIDFTTRAACSYSKYTQWTAASWMLLQHVVICLDRWLALLRPNWYRTKTIKFGVLAAVFAVTFQMTLYLPLFLTDYYIVKPAGMDCRITWALPNYQVFVRVVTMYIPQLIIFLSYPLFLFTLWFRHGRVQRPRIGPVGQSGEASTGRPTGQASVSRYSVSTIAATKSKKQASNQLRMVLWFVCLQIVCWLPVTVTTALLISALEYRSPLAVDVFQITEFLPVILLLADPVVFLVFLKDVRREVTAQLGLAIRAVQSVASHVATG